MPLNSYKCPECGKRNNYVVDLDEQGDQIVACSVCGHENNISYNELPQRVKDILRDLDSDAKIFADTDQHCRLDQNDTVDEALIQANARFQKVREEMASFDDIIGIEKSILRIADEYISEDTYDTITSVSSNILDETGELCSDWKQQSFSYLIDNVSERIDGDSSSARIISYMKKVIQSGRGIDAISDTELMKESGLNKKERFLIKQAVKNNQITNILQSVLESENF